MGFTHLFLIFILVALTQPLFCQDKGFTPQFQAVLSKKEGKSVLHQCSRKTYDKKHISFYRISAEMLALLHSNFEKVLELNEYGFKVEDLSKFAFQYIGIVLDGEKYIYVNAFSKQEVQTGEASDWRTKAVKVCDGGHSYWGALFHLKSLSFFELSFNGEG